MTFESMEHFDLLFETTGFLRRSSILSLVESPSGNFDNPLTLSQWVKETYGELKSRSWILHLVSSSSSSWCTNSGRGLIIVISTNSLILMINEIELKWWRSYEAGQTCVHQSLCPQLYIFIIFFRDKGCTSIVHSSFSSGGYRLVNSPTALGPKEN